MIKTIDWRNHFVAFISTLLGIFIAFQLEDWREKRAEDEHVKTTYESIKSEIEENVRIYKTNLTEIRDFLDYVDFVIEHSTGGRSFVVKAVDYNRYYDRFKNRFNDWKVVRSINDSINEYNGTMHIDFTPLTGISVSNWEAAKSTGVLNMADAKKVADLTYIYEWINKDLGFNDSDFYTYFVAHDKAFTNLGEMKANYKKLANIYEFKLNKIEARLNSMSF